VSPQLTSPHSRTALSKLSHYHLLHFTNILAGGKPVQTYRIIGPTGEEVGRYRSKADADSAVAALGAGTR